MYYSDFCFVDVAVGGATKRNRVHALDKLPDMVTATDCFTTMFRFRDEYRQHVKATSSVRGADKFPCWSDYLWFDIDSTSLEDATLHMQTLLRGLKSRKALMHTVVFFSGSKGYHIGVDASAFGFEPSPLLPQQMRATAQLIASKFEVPIDESIYNHNRLWRVVDTIHGKSKLRKTQIKTADALRLELGEIEKLVMKRRTYNPRYLLSSAIRPVTSLVQLRENAVSGTTKARSDGWIAPPLSERQRRKVQAGLNHLLARGVSKGKRDNEALLRASECRKLGYDSDECLELLLQWNQLNKPPKTVAAIERVVSSAYLGRGYDFGTNTESLRVAREQSCTGNTPTTRIQSKLRQAMSAVPRVFECGGIRVYDIADLMKQPELTEPPETALLGCAVIGSNTVLAGDSGTGKSTFVRSGVIQEAKQGRRTLWISAESERRFTWWFSRMYSHLKQGQIIWVDARFVGDDLVEPGEKRWEALRAVIEHFGCDFVIYDTLLSILTWIDGEVPKNDEMALWGRVIQELGDIALHAGSTPLILHHTNKDGQYALSAGIKNGCDNMWLFSAVGGNNANLRSLKVEKTRDGVQPYTVECDPDDNYHYEVRAVDNDNQPKQLSYPKSAIPLLRILVKGSIMRDELQRMTGLDRRRLTEFKQRFEIQSVRSGTNEWWEPTPEQIAEWTANGIKPQCGTEKQQESEGEK